MEKGILVGCDTKSEWLLPWWWDHYSKHNDYPVAFADFGMSDQAKKWCQENGVILQLPKEAFAPLQKVEPKMRRYWNKFVGKGIWLARPLWFLKPYACLHSPFEQTSWIDLDCEIRGSLQPLFSYLNSGAEIALYKEEWTQNHETLRQLKIFEKGEATYNSGVIAFRQKTQILLDWVQLAKHYNSRFVGDQNALSRAIYLFQPPIAELPVFYNWSMHSPPPEAALILHYLGSTKLILLKQLHPEAFSQ